VTYAASIALWTLPYRAGACPRPAGYDQVVSKAFTSEETPEAAPIVRAPPRLAPGAVRYVTPEGHAALRAELARLEADRAAGDSARADALARRVALVEATLATLTVLAPDAAPEGRVGFGGWVTVEDGAGVRATWRIVGPDESDARRGLVSVEAPLSRALLGREVGDEVEVDRPGGRATVTIVALRRAP
jgi:transcription elongation factor GreB